MAEEKIIIDVEVNTKEVRQNLADALHDVAQAKDEISKLNKEMNKGGEVSEKTA